MDSKTSRMTRASSLVILFSIIAFSGSLASSSEPQNNNITHNTQQHSANSSSLLGPLVYANSSQKKPIPNNSKPICLPSEVCQRVNKNCTLNFDGMSFDVRKITNNTEQFTIPNIQIDEKNETMVLGLCRGLTSIGCEGKTKNSQTSACLFDSSLLEKEKIKEKTKENSKIVGSHLYAQLRYSDKDLYYESFVSNKFCGNQTDAKSRLGTSIKFSCSDKDDKEPFFISFVNCTYNFGWRSKLMCRENLTDHLSKNGTTLDLSKSNHTDTRNSTQQLTTVSPSKAINGTHLNANETSTKTDPELSDSELKIKTDEAPKSAEGKHQATVNDSTKMTGIPEVMPGNVSANVTAKEPHQKGSQESANSINSSATLTPQPPLAKEVHASEPPAPAKMNRLHKFFMVSLIIISLASFIVVIFILDNKTRLRLPLNSIRRRARQALQPQPVPYSRVDDFNDSLDL